MPKSELLEYGFLSLSVLALPVCRCLKEEVYGKQNSSLNTKFGGGVGFCWFFCLFRAFLVLVVLGVFGVWFVVGFFLENNGNQRKGEEDAGS